MTEVRTACCVSFTCFFYCCGNLAWLSDETSLHAAWMADCQWAGKWLCWESRLVLWIDFVFFFLNYFTFDSKNVVDVYFSDQGPCSWYKDGATVYCIFNWADGNVYSRAAYSADSHENAWKTFHRWCVNYYYYYQQVNLSNNMFMLWMDSCQSNIVYNTVYHKITDFKSIDAALTWNKINGLCHCFGYNHPQDVCIL